jgi:hypothetical protein
VCGVNGDRTRSAGTCCYQAYGLTIEIPFACAGLAPADAVAGVDIVVEAGVVAPRLPSPVLSDPWFDAAPGSFLSRGGPRTGRFLVSRSDRVVFERNPEADDAMLAGHFTANVLPALLRHRGLLVLHANAAVANRTAVLVGGATGAGKSTTLAALLDRGFKMLSDDVTVLRFGREGAIEVVPGVARMHLTEAAASAVGVDLVTLPRQPWRRYKAAVPTEPDMATAASPLRAVYVLSSEPGERVSCTELAGAAKFDALLGCVYGPLLGGDHPALFPLLSGVLEQVAVFDLRRPDDRWSVGEVADCIAGAAARAVDAPGHVAGVGPADAEFGCRHALEVVSDAS